MIIAMGSKLDETNLSSNANSVFPSSSLTLSSSSKFKQIKVPFCIQNAKIIFQLKIIPSSKIITYFITCIVF